MITDYIFKAVSGQNLTVTEAENAMDTIISGDATDIQIGAFITAMSAKGTNPEEIAAFSSAMMRSAVKISPDVCGTAVDTCGTGGDGLNTFNISTASAIVTAGAGIPVVKHGNRSVSSSCGSADVLEELGVNINADVKTVELSLNKAGIGFLYAKKHHPAMRHAGRAREELGMRSFFNILGPISNPASAGARLLGVYDPKLTVKIAEVLHILGVKDAMVVHGSGLDEITTTGKTKISLFKSRGKIETYYITPENFGLKRAAMSDLKGGDPSYNAKVITGILEGKTGPRRDIVLLNSAAAIYLGGGAGSIEEGIEMAEISIDSKEAARTLMKLKDITTAKGGI